MIDNILWFLSLAPSALVYNYTLACLLDVPRKASLRSVMCVPSYRSGSTSTQAFSCF